MIIARNFAYKTLCPHATIMYVQKNEAVLRSRCCLKKFLFFNPGGHFCSEEWNHLCNFGRGYNGEYFKDVGSTLDNHCTQRAQSSHSSCSRQVHKIVNLAVKKGNILVNILLLKRFSHL